MARVILRQQILNVLAEHHLLTALQLLTELEKLGKSFNKTSVYRALDKLLADDQICRLSFGTNEIVYELRPHHHDHLVCTVCGKVRAVECSMELGHYEDFLPDHHHVTVFGLCGDCQ